MSTAFSTDHLSQRDRIPFWVDVASKTFFDHGFSTNRSDFGGHLNATRLDALKVVQCDFGPCEVTRSRNDISRDGIDDIVLSIRLKGRSHFSQSGHKVVVEPGTVNLQDSGRPMQFEFPEPTSSIFIVMPRQAVQTRISDSQFDRVLTTRNPVTGIMADFVRSIVPRINAMSPAVHTKLAEQSLDLISLAFAGPDSGTPLSTTRASALRRLKTEIERRLSDPALKPAEAAQAAGISVRYANLLLAEEGLSLERYIVDRRIENCRRALEDPLHAHRMIGEVAFAWGFSDHSHFTRRFRSAFGMTPGECRLRAKAGR